MAGKIPRWESELWSYLSASDGIRCPFYTDCHIRLSGQWCPDDHKIPMAMLLDAERFEFSDYDFIECGPCGGIIGMVEMLADKYLMQWRVHSPPVPTQLIPLIGKEHALEIRTLPLKAHHGATWCLKDGIVIQIKKDDPPAEKRLTLFHELFHVLSHHGATLHFRKARARQGAFNEMLACKFATYMLMPREWVEEKWAEVKDLNQMARIFDVPKPIMCIRLKRLGLI